MKSLREFTSLLETAVQAENPAVTVLFGAEFLGRRDTQPPRAVVFPHTRDGKMGSIGQPLLVHRLRSDVGIERRVVSIECWAHDLDEPEDAGAQDDALMELRGLLWRHAQAIVRSEAHSAPGAQPGIYQAQITAVTTPRERVQGARCDIVFWIDFMIRDPEPSEANVPATQVLTEVQ